MPKAHRIALLRGEQLEARQMLTVPDFALPDINENSTSFGNDVSPRDYMGEVTAWYFIRSFCSYCRSQGKFLHDLQVEFDRNYPSLDVSILIVDDKGALPTNEQLATDVAETLPFLRDTGVAWSTWEAAWRDVKIVDRANEFKDTINLTQNNLATPEAYATLKGMIIDVAKRTPLSPHQSPIEPLDVNNDSVISPIDALGVINDLGKYPNGTLPSSESVELSMYVDVNGDGAVAPADALAVINHLNVISQMDSQPQAPLSSSASSNSVADIDSLPPIMTETTMVAHHDLAGTLLAEEVAAAKVDHAALLAASRTPLHEWWLDRQTTAAPEKNDLFDTFDGCQDLSASVEAA